MSDIRPMTEVEQQLWREVAQLRRELTEAREIGGKWHEAALRLGESLDLVGPHDYYAMTPEEWLAWALQTMQAGQSEGER